MEAAWHHWIADLDEGPFRGAGFSERGTLENLRRGLAAPISAQHRHAWSDGLAMRAAPFGVFAAGRPAEAARLVAIDGTVSHDGEGIYGGQAVAAGVAAAMAGAPAPPWWPRRALSVVPDGLLDGPFAAPRGRAARGPPDRRGERAVRSAVVIGGYPWTDLAPEAVGPRLRRVRGGRRRLPESVLTAVNMGRDADTTAAVAGALAGALGGAAAIPAEWAAAIGPVRGSCLPSMAGYHVLDIAELLTPGDGRQAGHDPRTARRARSRRGPRTHAPPGHGTRAALPGRGRRRDTATAPAEAEADRRGQAEPSADPPAAASRACCSASPPGDAAGWPAARHRAARMPEWTRRLTRELDTFAEQNATTTLPVPIALNQPPEPLRLGPSDDAEWAAFAAEAVLTAGGRRCLSDLARDRRMRAAIDLAWNALASEVAAAADRAPEVESAVLPLRARISVRAGLGNLATGLRPPATGHDNPHYFDDAACVRACVLAVVHPGDPAAAAELAEFDARYTQDGDGVHGARAMAAAVAAGAGRRGRRRPASTAALAELPEGTEIGRNARHAVQLAAGRAPEPAAPSRWSRSWSTRSSTTSTATASPPPRPSRSRSPWPPPPAAGSPRRCPPPPASPGSPTPRPPWPAR